MIHLETNFGTIELALDTQNTPKTAENFLTYVKEGFYDGTIFHRVIDGFMIQGGGFSSGLGAKDAHAPIENEAKLGKLNKRGSVAMARTMDPHSATAQFFINVSDNDFLNFRAENREGFGYCVFAEVVKGMEVVDAIKAVRTGSQQGHQDVPVEEVVILKAFVVDEA